MIHELMSGILTAFFEVADNCLLYLTNCPVNVTTKDMEEAYLLTDTLIRFKKNSGSTQFLALSVILCAQYARANSGKAVSRISLSTLFSVFGFTSLF